MKTTTLKKSIRSIFIGMIAMMAFPIMADTGTSSPGSGDAILTIEQEDTFRKRMPSRKILHLIYEDEKVSIHSDIYIGEFSLTFENLESGEIHYLPSVTVGESAPFQLEHGEYQLTAVAEDGTVLSGFMQVY